MREHSFVKDQFYHIYCHAIDGLTLFKNKDDYSRFLALIFAGNGSRPLPRLERAGGLNLVWDIIAGKVDLGESLVDIICFCLMPTHFHLLLREKEDGNISRYLHKTQVSHSKYINLKYKRRGHVFESNFHSKHINTDAYLLILSCYLHKNSKDLKLWANKELDYPWSSYQDFVLESRWQSLLSSKVIMSQFKNGKDYQRFVEEHHQDIETGLNLV